MDLVGVNVSVVLDLMGLLELLLVGLELLLDSCSHDGDVLVLCTAGESMLPAEHLAAALEVLGFKVAGLEEAVSDLLGIF